MFPVETQDQTAGLCTNALCSKSLAPFAPREFHYLFSNHVVKGQTQTACRRTKVVRSLSFVPFPKIDQ